VPGAGTGLVLGSLVTANIEDRTGESCSGRRAWQFSRPRGAVADAEV